MADPIRSIADLMIDDIIDREGTTFTDDPLDRGGATKFGITQKSWLLYRAQEFGGSMLPDHVRDITEPQARRFYFVMYVKPLEWIDDIELRELVLDCSINHGATRTIKWLQRASACMAVDGFIGPETRKRVNDFGAPSMLYALVLMARVKLYAEIVVNDPTQLRFLKGWMNRVCEFIR